MSLYSLREVFLKKMMITDNDESIRQLNKEILAAESRLDVLEESFKHAMDPKAIHEVKGRIEEICTILGIEAEGPYRVNYNRKKLEEKR